MSRNLEIPQFTSCIAQEPFIKFGKGDGTTATTEIQPNLPQTNEFSAYGILPVEMGSGTFKAITIPPNADPFFGEITALKVGTTTEIVAKIDAKLQTVFGQYITVKYFPKTIQRQAYDPTWLSLGTYPQPPVYITITETIQEPITYLGDMPLSDVVNKVNTEGVKPVVTMNYAQQATVSFDKPPTTPVNAKQNLFIIEEYRMAAYLGKYGMGRVVKTFTLLPGEKTTITVKTYKDTTKTQTRSENVLDSYSESSANELDNLVQNERDDKTDSKRSADFIATASLSSGTFKKLTGFSASATLTTKNESSRGSLVKSINRALEKHVNNSNSNRQIQVNTTTTETTKEGEESATVRELVNLNKSRVLNFVFRQLHQQYITVTYLSDIKIAYTNGYEADARLVSLEELRGLLTNVLTPASIDAVERNILKNYCIVRDYKDSEVAFIEKKTWQVGTCADVPTVAASLSSTATPLAGVQAVPLEYFTFWRKKKDLTGIVSTYSFPITVPGIILAVKESTLKTSSVLAEAMLGQADALDCFNLKIQDAEAQKGYIDNTERISRIEREEAKAAADLEHQQSKMKYDLEYEQSKMKYDFERMQAETDLLRLQMQIINDLKDPVQRAEMYKKIFGNCCDTAQTVIQK